MFGQGSQNGAGMTFGNYWQQLTTAFKYFAVSSLALGVLGIFTPFVSSFLANNLLQTVNGMQIWRLFTSFLVDSSIINVLINLYILSTIIPELEKKYSTAYILIEIIIQNFYCNLAFVVIGEILVLLGLVDGRTYSCFGLTNLMFIFLWQMVALNPEEMTRFCCLPCIMPAKYLPWCFLLILTIQGGFGAIIGCLLGYYQFMGLKLLPNMQKWYYTTVQRWLPRAVKGNQGFVSIHSIESSSRTVISPSETNNFFNSNELMNDGVAIGGDSKEQSTDFRQHWVGQEQQEQIRSAQEKQLIVTPEALLDANGSDQSSINRLPTDLI